MSSIYCQLIAILLATNIACVLPGIFLVVRGVSLMSDALSHAILPGIVLLFLCNGHLSSPLLMVGAAIAGLATVLLTEAIIQTDRLQKDTALGLVFPFFFSCGVLLISLYARTIHLDMDSVILGHLVFAPFSRWIIYGIDCGPQALWIMTGLACINALVITVGYKHLVASSFDNAHSHTLGMRPRRTHYLLMLMTSITCVYAFDVVGALVVVALMVVPAATGALFATSMTHLVIYALMFSACGCWGGLLIAHTGDVSVTGSIATAMGVVMALGLFFYRRTQQHTHLGAHEPLLEISVLCSWLAQQSTTSTHTRVAKVFGWPLPYTNRILTYAHTVELLYYTIDKRVYLSAKGHALGVCPKLYLYGTLKTSSTTSKGGSG